jgi:predicted alpha-1,2-mannosidase
MKFFLLLLLFPGIATAQVPLKYVDPLIGTGPAKTSSSVRHSESGSENKGQTYPAVGRPFGMTQWTPETGTTEDKCISPYYYNDKYITGFRGSHWMSGSCTQDYGSASLMPFSTGKPDTLKHDPYSKFNHKNEISSPVYYKVLLDNSDIITELTGSTRAGMMRFTFPGKTSSYILIRMNNDEKTGKLWIDKERNEIAGYNPVHRIYNGKGKSAGFSGYFIIRFDKPFQPITQLMTQQKMVVCFNNEKIINVRIGTSFTSIEAARNNLDKEIPDWNFDASRKAGEDSWNQTLGKVLVKGGSQDDLIKFYTALYHCYQLPRIASDYEGSYHGFAQDSAIHKAGGFDYYDDFSMWDTYRVLHPLLTILEPKRSLDMVKSLILKAQQEGWMPIFPAWGNYTAAMIGDHVSTMISDAPIKGKTALNNESDHQAAYLFSMSGKPEITQERVNKIISEEYGTGPGGLSGNDDAGQMSAWLVFSMMGFYPVCPASNQYVITTPSFDEVKIFLPDGKIFLISSINREKTNKYIRVITRDGGRFNDWYITHEEIVKGSRFTFQLDSRPPLK